MPECVHREVIMFNSTTLIELIPAATFVSNYHTKMYDSEEQLLDV